MKYGHQSRGVGRMFQAGLAERPGDGSTLDTGITENDPKKALTNLYLKADSSLATKWSYL
jgi:hypothetical protein